MTNLKKMKQTNKQTILKTKSPKHSKELFKDQDAFFVFIFIGLLVFGYTG